MSVSQSVKAFTALSLISLALSAPSNAQNGELTCRRVNMIRSPFGPNQVLRCTDPSGREISTPRVTSQLRLSDGRTLAEFLRSNPGYNAGSFQTTMQEINTSGQNESDGRPFRRNRWADTPAVFNVQCGSGSRQICFGTVRMANGQTGSAGCAAVNGVCPDIDTCIHDQTVAQQNYRANDNERGTPPVNAVAK